MSVATILWIAALVPAITCCLNFKKSLWLYAGSIGFGIAVVVITLGLMVVGADVGEIFNR